MEMMVTGFVQNRDRNSPMANAIDTRNGWEETAVKGWINERRRL
jgi:hypothetical protein